MVIQSTKSILWGVVLVCLALVSACNGKPQDGKHVFSSQEKALRKAQALQGQLAEQDKKNRQLVQDAFRE